MMGWKPLAHQARRQVRSMSPLRILRILVLLKRVVVVAVDGRPPLRHGEQGSILVQREGAREGHEQPAPILKPVRFAVRIVLPSGRGWEGCLNGLKVAIHGAFRDLGMENLWSARWRLGPVGTAEGRVKKRLKMAKRRWRLGRPRSAGCRCVALASRRRRTVSACCSLSGRDGWPRGAGNVGKGLNL